MRYAIYFVPAENQPLWRKGCSILGYDSIAKRIVEQPKANGLEDGVLQELTAEPRRYGFHATLKAPFRLATGMTEETLIEQACDIAKRLHRVPGVALNVTQIGGFMALTPAGDTSHINALAADCVRAFDAFRAPMNTLERERRQRSSLTQRQTQFMDDWGYPYVFEEFRFHMTLTGTVPQHLRDPIQAFLNAFLNENDRMIEIDSVCLCVQRDNDKPFEVLQRFILG